MKTEKVWNTVDHLPVGKQIRGYNRDFLTSLAKRPLMLGLVSIAKRWPEPTRSNCVKPNTQKLFDIWEEFNKHDTNLTSGRRELFGAVFKIFICIYEAHQYYSQRFDWVMKMLLGAGWDTNDSNPSKYWND